MKWVFIVIAALLVLIAAGAAAYFLLPGVRSSEPENTARYFPGDVLAYSWATLSPGVAQGRHMLNIWEHFQDIPEFRDSVDEFLDEFEDDTGVDFEADVSPGSARIYPSRCWKQGTLSQQMRWRCSACRTTTPHQTF